MEGARLLARAEGSEVQPVFRVHGAPDPGSLEHLRAVLEGLIAAHQLEPSTWRWRAGESLADYLGRLPESRLRAAVERQVLITNRRSYFTSEPGRHFALGITPYSRFSAPMREIVGIFTHKEALEQLGLVPAAATPAEDEALRERVIEAANRAKERQRSLSKGVMQLAIDRILGEDPARRYEGTILGLRPTRLYVRLDAPPVELKVYVADLEEQLGTQLEVTADGAMLGSRFRLGDPLRLVARSRDRRGKWHLVPIGGPQKSAPPVPPAR
jgi:ribonuclease R